MVHQELSSKADGLEAEGLQRQREMEAMLKGHAQLLNKYDEMVERQRQHMHQAVVDEELEDLSHLFNSPKVQRAMQGNSRMMAFWTDQLR